MDIYHYIWYRGEPRKVTTNIIHIMPYIIENEYSIIYKIYIRTYNDCIIGSEDFIERKS